MATLSTIVVRASADVYLGAAQFQLMVNGKALGGVQSVTAYHSQNAWQQFTFSGDFGTTGPSKVEVVYLNDYSAGTAAKDRNLYIDKITVNGKIFESETVGFYDRAYKSPDLTGTEAMLWAGKMVYDTTGSAPTTTTTTKPSTLDTIVVRASGDYYDGSPQFQLLVDGKQVGTTQTVSAVHDKGQWQDFSFTTDLGSDNAAKVEVVYINDRYGGSGLDRNLYVDKITVNGTVYQSETDAVFISSKGTVSDGREKMSGAGKLVFDVGDVAPAPTPDPTPAPKPSPSPTPGATGEFTIGDDGKFYDPQGHVFDLHGANLFPNQYGSSFIEAVGPDGWDFNSLRINYIPSVFTYDQLDKAIDAYTSLGIVTIVNWHKTGGYGDSATDRNAILDHFEYLATKYKDNPYVWYGGYGEPGGSGDAIQVNGKWQWDPKDVDRWVDLSRDIIETVRDAGATAPVWAPSMVLGQDIMIDSNWNRVGFSMPIGERSAILKYGDRITSGYDNVAFDVHLYGNYNSTDRLKDLDLFLDTAEDRGLAIVFGEYGGTVGINPNGNKPSTIQSTRNMAELRDEHSFGDMVWHAQSSGAHDLTTSGQGGVLNTNNFTSPTNLTELGQIVWEGTH